VIDVTRLGGGALVINVDLILSIEQTPDTMIAFSNGEKLLVLETPAVLIERVLAFRRRFSDCLSRGCRNEDDHAE
jgi:flagellar protein FlbD